MKKLSLLFSMICLGLVSPVWSDTIVSSAPNDSWVVQFNGETGFPTGRLSNTVNESWGGEVSAGYRFSQNWQVSLESGYEGYTAKNALNTYWNLVPLVLKGQYYFASAAIQPFVFVGAGMAFNTLSSSLAGPLGLMGEHDFLGEVGLGLSIAFVEKINILIQTKVEIDATSSNYAVDQPTVLIPIDLGLIFTID